MKLLYSSKLRHSYWLAMAKVSADVPAWVKPGWECGERRLMLVLLWSCAVCHLPPRHLLKLPNVLTCRMHPGRDQLKAHCPLSMPWRMVGSTTDPTWSPRLCQREPCLPQLLSWRWCNVGAHLVVKEATVNVAPLAVLFSVRAKEVRCAWTCSQRNRKNHYLLMMIMMMNCSWNFWQLKSYSLGQSKEVTSSGFLFLPL